MTPKSHILERPRIFALPKLKVDFVIQHRNEIKVRQKYEDFKCRKRFWITFTNLFNFFKKSFFLNFNCLNEE